MEHPFIHDLDSKTLEELQTAISSLTSKLSFAYRSGNQPLIHQLNLAINSYRAAYTKKMDDLVAKQKIQTQIKVENKK